MEHRPQGILSIAGFERLQQGTLGGQFSWPEVAREFWRSKGNAVSRYHEPPLRSRDEAEVWGLNETELRSNVFESVVSDSLIRVSQGAQWKALRASIFSRLESTYDFRDIAQVKQFLEKHVFLTPLLLEASTKIKEYFRPSANLALEVPVDPEDGKYQELWIRIQTDVAPADALPLLTKFDDEWWLEASANSKNLLNIKLEYV